MAIYKQILDLFTMDDDDSRFSITDPFYYEQYAAATNGHMLCYFDKDLVDLEQPAGQLPNINAIIPASLPSSIEFDVAKLQNDQLDEKEAEFNQQLRTYEKDECKECRGTGTCECRCGDEHDCAECDGEGVGGEPPAYDTLGSINGKAFQYRYLTKVRLAAELNGTPTLRYYDQGPTRTSLFEFGNVRVILMPVVTEKESPELLS